MITFALERFPRSAIFLHDIESAVLVDMASKMKPDLSVFTIDTGRLHPETHVFIELMRRRYQIDIDVLHPDTIRMEAMVKRKGLFSFYTDGRDECCRARIIEPMQKMLTLLDAWISGQRRVNGMTRAQLPVVQIDASFGESSPLLVKVNPLAKWSVMEVWEYVRKNEVPYNELYAFGFETIACEPCLDEVQ